MINSLYIHIPFCKKKCNYCDFVSYAGKEELMDEYVEALCEEINSPPYQHESNPPPSLVKRGGNEGGEFSTVYFGGGTPTLLELRHFEKILTALTRQRLTLPPLPEGEGPEGMTVEITIEANPGTADKAKLKALRQLSINRLSIGAQSFNDRHLQILGRIHTAEETLKFNDDARSAGFDNINLDLIFALPDQTLDEWKDDLQKAVDLKPNHLSTYNLQIEEGTPLWKMTNKPSPDTLKTLTLSQRERVLPFAHNSPQGVSFSLWEKGASLMPADEGFKLPTEDEELAIYEHTIETLTSRGFKHYEISNFAKPGFECQHNINYWKNGNYIGIGAGAHSHVNGKRWANSDSIEEYLSSVAGRLSPVRRQETGDWRQETIFMGLRLLGGLPIEKFTGFEKEVAELIKDGLLMRENNHYKLTRKGLYLANLVFEKFV